MPDGRKKSIYIYFDFPRQQKLFCVIFLAFNSHKKERATKICVQLHYSNEVNQKIHRLSHVASNMQQTRARFAFRLKHSMNALDKSRYVIQFCFVINCSVKYLGVTVSMTLLNIASKEGVQRFCVRLKCESEPIIKRNYSHLNIEKGNFVWILVIILSLLIF